MSAEYELKTITDNVLKGYVRQDRNNRRCVIFMHGFRGDLTETWQPRGSVGFAEYLTQDDELADFDFLFFGYKSGLLGGASAKNISVQLKNQIDAHLANKQIVLVAHSYGGIISMRYIVDRLEKGERMPVIGLVMYGTPTTGSELVNIAELSGLALNLKLPGAGTLLRWLIRRNRQMQELAAHSEFLQELHDQWIYRVANGGSSLEPDTRRRAFMNVRMVTGNEDWVVKERSAKGIYGEIDWHPLDYGHIALVKPESNTDARYHALTSFLKQKLPGLEPTRLSRVKHFSDAIWNTRSSRAIRDWRFDASLDLDQSFADSKLARAGFASSSYRCRYRTALTSSSIHIGLSCGHKGRIQVWDHNPEPYYAHQILVDLLPEADRGKLTKAVERALSEGDLEEQWNRLFPEISVKINGERTAEREIVPDAGPNDGWLRRRYELTENQFDLIGTEVEFDLTYTSLVPKSLTSFRVFYPWLVDGCTCSVTIKADLETFVPVYQFPLGLDFKPQPEPPTTNSRSLTVKSNDLILPESSFWLFWQRRNK